MPPRAGANSGRYMLLLCKFESRLLRYVEQHAFIPDAAIHMLFAHHACFSLYSRKTKTTSSNNPFGAANARANKARQDLRNKASPVRADHNADGYTTVLSRREKKKKKNEKKAKDLQPAFDETVETVAVDTKPPVPEFHQEATDFPDLKTPATTSPATPIRGQPKRRVNATTDPLFPVTHLIECYYQDPEASNSSEFSKHLGIATSVPGGKGFYNVRHVIWDASKGRWVYDGDVSKGIHWNEKEVCTPLCRHGIWYPTQSTLEQAGLDQINGRPELMPSPEDCVQMSGDVAVASQEVKEMPSPDVDNKKEQGKVNTINI